MIVPRFTQERCLILSDSGVVSLLACAMASEQQAIDGAEPGLIVPAWWWGNAEDFDLIISALEPGVRSQGEHCSIPVETRCAIYPADTASVGVHDSVGESQTRLLLDAAHLAMRSGFRRIVWPIRIPEDHPDRIRAIADALDRAMLVSRLATIDAAPYDTPEVVIETPFIDLSDQQVEELSEDMAIPVETCWWAGITDLPEASMRARRWSGITPDGSAMLEPKPGVGTKI